MKVRKHAHLWNEVRPDLRPRMLAMRAVDVPIASIAAALGVREDVVMRSLAEPAPVPQPPPRRRVQPKPQPPALVPRRAAGQRCIECFCDTPDGSPPKCDKCRRADRQFGMISEELTGMEYA